MRTVTFTFGSLLLAVICFCGCGGPSQPELSGPVTSQGSTPELSDTAASRDQEAAVAPSAPEDLATTAEEAADPTPDGDDVQALTRAAADLVADAPGTSTERVAEATPELPPAERILLLTSAGPLLVDLHITIEGQPYREAFDKLIDEVLALADEDDDGSVLWSELTAHPRFRYGQFGNPPTATYQSQQQMTRLYDWIQNGRVDREEVARYLTSNQGSSQALAIETSSFNRVLGRDDSPIRRWLDVDADMVLSAEEIAGARLRLRMRDANDDEILLPVDFLTTQEEPTMVTTRRRRRSGPEAGWHIGEQTPWEELLYGWEEFYATAGDLTADDLMLGHDFFNKLDIDADGTLRAYELETLLAIESHLAIRVELPPEGDPRPSVSLAALRIPLDMVHGVVQHQSDRLTISLPGVVLDIFAKDLLGQVDFDAQAEEFIRRADADKNDYLSNDEFEAISAQLNVAREAVDLDQNEMIFADEIATTLRQRQSAQRSQIRVKADDQSDALVGTLDVNHDGRVDSREIAASAESLKSLDANNDGRVPLHEMSSAMVIGVVRGTVASIPNAFDVPATERVASEAAPPWFRGMDRNNDGGISRREFLGTRGQFDLLDADADGFVDVTEADMP